jgi:hypothetical protein
MNTYEVRVRLPRGSFTTVLIQADCQYTARQLAEAQYGAGSVMGVLGEVR